MTTDITWHVEKRKVSDLLPADYNPRKMTERERKDLEDSIKEFGAVVPLVLNIGKRKDVIIGGHQRTTIYADLGIKEIDTMVPNRELTKNEEKKLNLRLNKNTGSWDLEKLRELGLGILTEVGFNQIEVTNIFDIKQTADDNFNLEEEEKKAEKTKIKRGDIFQLGNHRIMCGDVRDPKDMAKLMGGVKADMVFTDPPYNVDYQGSMNSKTKNKREAIQNDAMSPEQFKTFLNDTMASMLTHCDGVYYICMSSKELAALKDVFEKNGGHWQSFIIWVKNTFTLSRADWQNQYEPILYGWSAKTKNHYFSGFRDEGNVWENLDKLNPTFDGKETTLKVGAYHLKLKGEIEGKLIRKNETLDIWHEKKPTKSSEHPTMKPIRLVAKAIKASSKVNDIVLDPFSGSGSTIIACQETNRKGYGMEIEPKYVQVIINRWKLLTNQVEKKL